MPLILGTNSIKDSAYNVANSLRLESGSSDNLTRSQTSGNRNKATLSAWVKRSKLGANQAFFGIHGASSDAGQIEIRFQSSGEGFHISGQATNWRRTNKHFRDISAWYHLVVAFDTTLSTASDRVKVYVNGVQETSFAASGDPSQDSDLPFGLSGATCSIGSDFNAGSAGNFFGGYLAEVVLIDGQQLDATSFGEFDEDSPTIWKPKDVSGLTFGTNGFYLDFENSAELGTDVSGNSNTFTENNLTSIDQSTDTCTNNFATLNPLYKQDGSFSEGNLQYTISSADFDSGVSTFGASSGKWYFETKITAQSSEPTTRNAFGICDERDGNLIAEGEYGQNPTGRLGDTTGWSGNGSGNVLKNGSDQGSGFNTTYTTNDVLSCAVDLDNGAVYYRKNGGSWLNSADPTSGSSKTGAVIITTGETYLFGNTAYSGSAFQMNFGSPPYSISSGNSDAEGFGNFEYAPPSGYFALCTKNLAEYG